MGFHIARGKQNEATKQVGRATFNLIDRDHVRRSCFYLRVALSKGSSKAKVFALELTFSRCALMSLAIGAISRELSASCFPEAI